MCHRTNFVKNLIENFSKISKIEKNDDKKDAAVGELSGSTVRFMYCYTQVICRYWKEKTFFRIFF